MITKAIEKLTAESIRLNSNHSQAIAEYLIDHITEDSAARIVHDSKSLEGCVSNFIKSQKQGSQQLRDDF